MLCHVSALQQAEGKAGVAKQMNRPQRVRDSGPATLRDWAAGTMDRDQPALGAPDYGPGASGELLRGRQGRLIPRRPG